jgi:ribonuclease P protein component
MFPLLLGAKVFQNNVFLLKFVQNSGAGSRFCFSVSKKISKSAAVRNRLRRAGYRFLDRYVSQIKSKTLVIFYFRVLPKNNEEIIKNMELILKESKLIK